MILRNKKGKELIIANDEEFIYYKMSEIDKINLRENNNKIYTIGFEKDRKKYNFLFMNNPYLIKIYNTSLVKLFSKEK